MHSLIKTPFAKCSTVFVVAFALLICLWVRPGASTKAQQPPNDRVAGREREVPNPDKIALESQIVELQTTIDLLQLEQDADRTPLLSAIAKLKYIGSIPHDQLYTFNGAVTYLGVAPIIAENDDNQQAATERVVDKKLNDLRASIHNNKLEYRKSSVVLHRKKFELNSLLRRYNKPE